MMDGAIVFLILAHFAISITSLIFLAAILHKIR